MNYLRESLAELKRLTIMGWTLALIVLGLWLLVTIWGNGMGPHCYVSPRGVEVCDPAVEEWAEHEEAEERLRQGFFGDLLDKERSRGHAER
jgi:hypothetical protein